MLRRIASLPGLVAALSLAVAACSPRIENERLSDRELDARADDLTDRADALVEQRLGEISGRTSDGSLPSPILAADSDTP